MDGGRGRARGRAGSREAEREPWVQDYDAKPHAAASTVEQDCAVARAEPAEKSLAVRIEEDGKKLADALSEEHKDHVRFKSFDELHRKSLLCLAYLERKITVLKKRDQVVALQADVPRFQAVEQAVMSSEVEAVAKVGELILRMDDAQKAYIELRGARAEPYSAFSASKRKLVELISEV